jgi:hypothetical protein
MNIWSESIINVLQRIKINSTQLHNKHRQRYIEFSNMSRIFDVPIIVFSVFSASFSSLNVINPDHGIIITTSISMIITILSSIKLYLNLSSNINDEVALSKSYYILSINIFKMISLKPQEQNAKIFLDTCFSEYTKLTEQSSLLHKNIKKDLLTINDYNVDDNSSSTLSSSGSSNNIILNNDNNDL